MQPAQPGPIAWADLILRSCTNPNFPNLSSVMIHIGFTDGHRLFLSLN